MSFDHRQDSAADPLVSRPRRVSPPLMLAGVAGACVLGAGLGRWARPSDIAHDPAPRAAAAAPKSPAARRQIEIRVDRPPAPALAEPPATAAATAPSPKPPSPPELLAPKPPPEGLLRVRAVAPQRLAETPLRARKAEEAQVAADAARKTKAAHKLEARAAAARKARLESARIAAAAAEAHKAERRLAQHKAAEKKAAEHRLAAQTAAKQKAQLAQAKAARLRAAARLAEEKVRRPPPAKSSLARGGGPVRVASLGARCASTDPGAALTCADPALGAAERQLARAYRQAQAAGVPPERLERQQQRWLVARANAARQAPWAVHDIYLARIAELQDQTREAARGD